MYTCTRVYLPLVPFLWPQVEELLESSLVLCSTAQTGSTYNVHSGMWKPCCAFTLTAEQHSEMWIKAARP